MKIKVIKVVGHIELSHNDNTWNCDSDENMVYAELNKKQKLLRNLKVGESFALIACNGGGEISIGSFKLLEKKG